MAGSASPSVTASASATPSASATVAACRASQLKVTLVTSGVATGNVGAVIGFANQGTAPCQLSGWPKVVGVTAAGATAGAGHTLTTMFGPIGLSAPPVVVLAPGTQAEAVVAASDEPGQGSTCPPTYHQLRIGAPGLPGKNVIRAWLTAVNGYLPTCVPITVTPVVAASAISIG